MLERLNTAVRRWSAIGVLAAALGALLWLTRDDGASGRERSPRITWSARLDLETFRAHLARRLERAKSVVAQSRTDARPATRPAGKWPMQGKGPLKGMVTEFMHPDCWLGPREVCDTLADLITGCDAGDASDCLAVGQFLADTPPRMLIASTFFIQACLIGDPVGCERVDDLRSTSNIPCERDPFACSHRGFRTNDAALHEEACSLGAAESCQWLSDADDDELSRAYVETACQLGSPLSCWALAGSLSPNCREREGEGQRCYPADEDVAKIAREMACAAGWSEGLDCS
jgi:hypothetical protein